MPKFNEWVQAGNVPILRCGFLYYGEGTPDAPQPGDIKGEFDAIAKNMVWFKYHEDNGWVEKTTPTSSVKSDGFFVFNNEVENQPIARIGIFYNDNEDPSTLGKPKVIPLTRIVESSDGSLDCVSVGSGRRNICLINSGSYGLQSGYLNNEQTYTQGNGTDFITATEIENVFTFDRDVWCNEIIMKLGGTLKRARTRIFNNVTGVKIYDSTTDFEWENNINQNPDFAWPDGTVIPLVAEWEFIMRANTEYRMVRNVLEPIKAYGTLVGEVFTPYMGLKTKDLHESYIVHRDLLRPIEKTLADTGYIITELNTITMSGTKGALNFTVDSNTTIFEILDNYAWLGGGGSVTITFGNGQAITLSNARDFVKFTKSNAGVWSYFNIRTNSGAVVPTP